MRIAEATNRLTADQRLRFFEVLAHNITVAVRGAAWPAIASPIRICW
jgi:hypothetical protein